jgi:hypothetical protein
MPDTQQYCQSSKPLSVEHVQAIQSHGYYCLLCGTDTWGAMLSGSSQECYWRKSEKPRRELDRDHNPLRQELISRTSWIRSRYKPSTAPLFVHSSLCWYTEGGGKFKYWNWQLLYSKTTWRVRKESRLMKFLEAFRQTSNDFSFGLLVTWESVLARLQSVKTTFKSTHHRFKVWFYSILYSIQAGTVPLGLRWVLLLVPENVYVLRDPNSRMVFRTRKKNWKS